MVLRALLESEYPLTRYVARPLTRPIAERVGSRMSPNNITGVATLVGLGAGLAVALGSMLLGATLIFATFLLDCLDGDVARLRGRVTPLGKFLDATLDRIVDGALVGALVIFNPEAFLLPGLLLIVGSFVVSYVRRMAASFSIECKVGLAGRDLRLVTLSLLAILLLVSMLFAWIALWGLAIVTSITAVHRTVYVAGRLRADGTE